MYYINIYNIFLNLCDLCEKLKFYCDTTCNFSMENKKSKWNLISNLRRLSNGVVAFQGLGIHYLKRLLQQLLI